MSFALRQDKQRMAQFLLRHRDFRPRDFSAPYPTFTDSAAVFGEIQNERRHSPASAASPFAST